MRWKTPGLKAGGPVTEARPGSWPRVAVTRTPLFAPGMGSRAHQAAPSATRGQAVEGSGKGRWTQTVGTHLQDCGQRQLRERDAVGLAVQVLQDEVIQLLHQAVLGQQGRKEKVGAGETGALRSSRAVGCVHSVCRVETGGRAPTASQKPRSHSVWLRPRNTIPLPSQETRKVHTNSTLS